MILVYESRTNERKIEQMEYAHLDNKTF